MNKNLEKKIEERKNEAERKNLGLKSHTIARYLGYGHDNPGCNGREDRYFKFENKNFVITHRYHCDYGNDGMYGRGGNNVFYKGEQVYHDAIYPVLSYVPGEWEEEFEELYREASKAESKNKKEKKEKEMAVKAEGIKREKAKWGL